MKFRVFGKSKSSRDLDKLTERVRKALDRETAPPPQAFPVARRIERALRQAVFRQGALILTGGELFPVVLKDISESGARIEFFIRRELPETVILVEPTLPLKAKARLVWQRNGVAGLAFLRD